MPTRRRAVAPTSPRTRRRRRSLSVCAGSLQRMSSGSEFSARNSMRRGRRSSMRARPGTSSSGSSSRRDRAVDKQATAMRGSGRRRLCDRSIASLSPGRRSRKRLSFVMHCAALAELARSGAASRTGCSGSSRQLGWRPRRRRRSIRSSVARARRPMRKRIKGMHLRTELAPTAERLRAAPGILLRSEAGTSRPLTLRSCASQMVRARAERLDALEATVTR
mmetsp:Transcript_25619/g.56497  ORF Transcript_25619/g.56497 Transcript_25619/m.56497 type:complete len:221 (-) Transcript_25619:333-995(-)